MEKTILISMPVEDLQTLIVDCVNSCLKHSQPQPIARTIKLSEKAVPKKEMAKELGVSDNTMTNWMKEGLPYSKIGRLVYFDPDKVYEYMRHTQLKRA